MAMPQSCWPVVVSARLLEPPEAHWVKRWPADLGDRVRSQLKAKSSQP